MCNKHKICDCTVTVCTWTIRILDELKENDRVAKIVSLCAIEPAPTDCIAINYIAQSRDHTYDYLTRIAVSHEMPRWWWRAILMSTNRMHLCPVRLIFRPFSDLLYIEENNIAFLPHQHKIGKFPCFNKHHVKFKQLKSNINWKNVMNLINWFIYIQ